MHVVIKHYAEETETHDVEAKSRKRRHIDAFRLSVLNTVTTSKQVSTRTAAVRLSECKYHRVARNVMAASDSFGGMIFTLIGISLGQIALFVWI